MGHLEQTYITIMVSKSVSGKEFQKVSSTQALISSTEQICLEYQNPQFFSVHKFPLNCAMLVDTGSKNFTSKRFSLL